MARKIKKLLCTVAVIVLWLAVWQICAMLVGKEVVLPTPMAVLKRFFELVKTSAMWKATGSSLLRIMGGYLAGVLIGALLGMAMYFIKAVRTVFSPFLTVVKSTPVASFILIAYFMISDTAIPVFITFLMVLPMMAASVFTSLESTDKELLEVTKVYSFSFAKKLKTLYIPTVAPHFLSQAFIALGFGWKAGIAAEVLCTPKNSIGKYLYDSKTYLETDDTFAYTLLIILISLCLEKLLKVLVGKVKGGVK